MRLGFRENFVVFGSDKGLTYLTDTASGSSGSPVADDKWTVAALHTGSQDISAKNIKLLGKEIHEENFGIPIPAIMAKLRDRLSCNPPGNSCGPGINLAHTSRQHG